MSNPCSNELQFYFETEENQKVFEDFFNEHFGCVDMTENTVYFESRWSFPEEEMNELYLKLPNKEDINMICLSVEWGCLYCEFITCDEDGWKHETN